MLTSVVNVKVVSTKVHISLCIQPPMILIQLINSISSSLYTALCYCHLQVTDMTKWHTKIQEALLIVDQSWSLKTSTMAAEHGQGEHQAVTNFREYLRIKTVEPDPDYGKNSKHTGPKYPLDWNYESCN